jgi:hypothetical protein
LNTAFFELINNNTSLTLYKFPSCKCFKAIKNLASKSLEEWERDEEEE